jgi:hypothetical protein
MSQPLHPPAVAAVAVGRDQAAGWPPAWPHLLPRHPNHQHSLDAEISQSEKDIKSKSLETLKACGAVLRIQKFWLDQKPKKQDSDTSSNDFKKWNNCKGSQIKQLKHWKHYFKKLLI